MLAGSINSMVNFYGDRTSSLPYLFYLFNASNIPTVFRAFQGLAWIKTSGINGLHVLYLLYFSLHFKFIYDFRIFKVDDPGTDPDPNAFHAIVFSPALTYSSIPHRRFCYQCDRTDLF